MKDASPDPNAVTWRDAIDKLPQIDSWHDWGQIFLDVPTWSPLVREICRRAGLPCRTVKAGFPGSNAVFLVNAGDPDARVVVKIYAPLCPEDYDFEREIHPLLARMPGIGAPRLVAHGVLVSETRWPYTVLSYVPGVPIREVRDQIPERELREVAFDLGQRVRLLHSMPVDAVTSLDPGSAVWKRYVIHQVPRTVQRLRREAELPNHILGQIPEFIAGVLEEFSSSTDAEPQGQALFLVNGDITEDHVLLIQDGDRWRISGLIDFADARIAPADYEWVALWFGALDREPDALEAFFRGYDPAVHLNATFYRRALAFTFLHEFGAEIIAQTLPQRVQRDLRTLGDLLEVLWQPS